MTIDPSELNLTELQLAVVRVVWARPDASVQEIQAVLGRTRPLAISTITTVLTRLADRGVVERTKRGRQYRWRALVSEEQVTGALVDGLAERAFEGDPGALVCSLLERHDLSPGDLERVRELLDEQDRQAASDGTHEKNPTKADDGTESTGSGRRKTR